MPSPSRQRIGSHEHSNYAALSALKIGVSPIEGVVVMVPSHCDGRHAKHSKSHSDDQQCPLHDQVLPLWVMGSPTGFKR
jgi:hypothetical protein